MLENPVPRCRSLLVHCRKNPKPFRLSSDPDSKYELAAIESNMPSIFPKLQILLTTPAGARHRRYSCSIAKALDTIATGLSSAALSRVTRPKLMVRPSRTTLASASTSELATARMKWVVWSTVVIGR
jgi:phage baseplate assembly protein W